MLFKALLTRLNHGSGSGSAQALESSRRFSKATYQRYPKLAELVIRLFKESNGAHGHGSTLTGSRHVEFAFPAMAIIETVGVFSDHRDDVCKFLLDRLGSPDWRLREKAASTLGLLVDEDIMIQEIAELRERRSSSQNELHGRLLCLNYLIDRPKHDPSSRLPAFV